MFGRLAIAIIGVFAILLARWPERPEPGTFAPYYTLLAACLLNLVYLILARTGVGLKGLATVQLSLDILIVALLAGRLTAEVSRVRILNDEILQNMAGGVVAADRFGGVQFINGPAGKLLGLRDGEDFRGRQIDDVLPREVAEILRRAMRS